MPQNGHAPIVEILLEQNVQKTRREWEDLGALATRSGHSHVAKIILKAVEHVRGPGRCGMMRTCSTALKMIVIVLSLLLTSCGRPPQVAIRYQ